MNGNTMESDIYWRDIKEDESIFDPINSKRGILILTDIMDKEPRSTICNYVDCYTYVDRDSHEIVTHYAFL